ncbi:MAG: YggT family protein [Bacillota bacterium]
MFIVLFQIINYLILARILLSFFPVNPYSSPVLLNIVHFVRQTTEPLLAPFRNLVPPLRMGVGYLDFSPILALIVLSIVRNLLLRFL